MTKASSHLFVFGLDLMRAIAIVLVIIEHTVTINPQIKSIDLRLSGVSVFFVLSGFLIGNKIQLHSSDPKASLGIFIRNRITKTFPSYFVVLFLITCVFLFSDQSTIDLDWSYFVFCQNLYSHELHFFPESWSLSVEEWFYLSVSAFIFLNRFYPKIQPKTIILVLIFSLILKQVLLYYFIPSSNPISQKSVAVQLDYLFFGWLMSLFCAAFQSFFNLHSGALLFLSLIGLFFLETNLFPSPQLRNTSEMLSISLALPFLSSFQRENVTIRNKIISYLARRSYSLYLINLTIVQVILLPVINKYVLSLSNPWVCVFVYFFSTLVLAEFLYQFVETKGLKLRKYWPIENEKS